LKRYPFDYVLGSLHWVGAETIFDPNYFRRRTQDEAFTAYFVELERLTRIGEFDILSHFDVLIRAWGEMGGRYDPLEYEDAIRPVLRNCIARGIALDINTKGLRSKINMLTPDIDILRWYAEMGGERVTLGSDSHQPHNVGADLDKALSAAQAAGIKWLTQFEGRESTLISID
ncbi:MAG: PHP domain-containing protein, partial [Chloroflexota bacterium]